VVQVIHAELKRLGEKAVPGDEFAARKLVLTGGFQRELETNEAYVKRIAEFVTHDLPPNAFEATLGKLERVTVEEVNAFAKEELNPKAMTVVVVGRAEECEKPLRKIFPKLRVIPQEKVELD
jgi:zinc protease